LASCLEPFHLRELFSVLTVNVNALSLAVPTSSASLGSTWLLFPPEQEERKMAAATVNKKVYFISDIILRQKYDFLD
jgi:hypothetical protein